MRIRLSAVLFVSMMSLTASFLPAAEPEEAANAERTAELIKQLAGEDPKACAKAAKELGEIEPASLEAALELGNVYERDDFREDDPREIKPKYGKTFRAAYASILKIGPGLVEELTAALEDEEAKTRTLAARALGLIGPEAAEAAPALLALLRKKGEPWRVHRAAIFGLGGMPAAAKEATRDIVEYVVHEEFGMRLAASWALYKIGCEDEETVRLLEPLRKHRNEKVAWYASHILGRIREEQKKRAAATAKKKPKADEPEKDDPKDEDEF